MFLGVCGAGALVEVAAAFFSVLAELKSPPCAVFCGGAVELGGVYRFGVVLGEAGEVVAAASSNKSGRSRSPGPRFRQFEVGAASGRGHRGGDVAVPVVRVLLGVLVAVAAVVLFQFCGIGLERLA